MTMGQDGCVHLFTTATHRPMTYRRHGWQYADQVRCSDCEARVTMTAYDDPRDDVLRRFLPQDGRKEERP